LNKKETKLIIAAIILFFALILYAISIIKGGLK